jgi:hypothetical protein
MPPVGTLVDKFLLRKSGITLVTKGNFSSLMRQQFSFFPPYRARAAQFSYSE